MLNVHACGTKRKVCTFGFVFKKDDVKYKSPSRFNPMNTTQSIKSINPFTNTRYKIVIGLRFGMLHVPVQKIKTRERIITA